MTSPITLDAVHQMVGSVFENYQAAIQLLKDVAEGHATQGEIIDFLAPLGVVLGDAQPVTATVRSRTRALQLLKRDEPFDGIKFREWTNPIKDSLINVIDDMTDDVFDGALNSTDFYLVGLALRYGLASAQGGMVMNKGPDHKDRAVCITLVTGLLKELRA